MSKRMRAVLSAVRGQEFDVVDAQFFYPDGPAAMRVAAALGLPYSVKARGADISHFGHDPATAPQLIAAADKAAGLLVLEGIIRKGLHARLTRDDVIVSATTIASLRRFKDDVAEVRAGLECGVVLSDTNDIKAGDNLEVFEVEMRERTL